MVDFYTNVSVLGDSILYRGVRNGKRIKERVPFKPSLFLNSKEKTEFKTIDGRYANKMDFDSIKEAREFYHRYKDVDNFDIYGNMNFEYAYIASHFKHDINWDRKYIRIDDIDIEVDSTDGFPDPSIAEREITAITVIRGKNISAFGCDDFDKTKIANNPEYEGYNITYYKLDSEIDLISRYLRFYEDDVPDILTGWYIQFFDIPYLINRIIRLFGEATAKRLSPWGQIYKRTVTLMQKDHETYNITGVGILDYIELFRKFAPGGTSVENYKLNTIAEVVLNEQKMSYAEYGNITQLMSGEFDVKIDEKVEKGSVRHKAKLRTAIKENLSLVHERKSNL